MVLFSETETAKQNQKFPFHFLSALPTPPAENLKLRKENFWFLLPRPKGADEARRIRAYDLVSLHHALRACDIICFENKCELGTIQTPIGNSTIFSVDTSGRRKAPTKDFLAGLQENSEFLARKRAVFFRQEAGASQRFLWHRPF